jgi:phosphorylcholine metabolism protein LicD
MKNKLLGEYVMKDKVKILIENSFFKLRIIRLIYDKTVVRYKLYRKHKDFTNYNAEILEKLSCAFEELKINYWLDFGTLLGAVREKKFISHDLDIDIGVLGTMKVEDRNKISNILLKYGFQKNIILNIIIL